MRNGSFSFEKSIVIINLPLKSHNQSTELLIDVVTPEVRDIDNRLYVFITQNDLDKSIRQRNINVAFHKG